MDWRRSNVRERDGIWTRCEDGNRITIRIVGHEGQIFLLFLLLFFTTLPFVLAAESSPTHLTSQDGWVQDESCIRWETDSETYGRGIINLKHDVKKFKIAQRFLGMGETRDMERVGNAFLRR